MTEDKIEPTVKIAHKPEITSEEKYRAVSAILPILDRNSRLIISGSLSQRISTLEHNGRCLLKHSLC